jgi:1,4-dihydroxy-2-naphthoate polyprenyltransferase
VNNLRDIATDRAAGKVTSAVRLGPRMTRRLYEALVAGAFVAVAVTAWAAQSAWPLIGLLAAPFAARPLRTVRGAEGPALVPALATTAGLQLEVAVLLAVGLWVA